LQVIDNNSLVAITTNVEDILNLVTDCFVVVDVDNLETSFGNDLKTRTA